MKMNRLMMPIMMICLVGCTYPMPGSARDEHGCLGSAGYLWCARTQQCERPWELAKKVDSAYINNHFEEYCLSREDAN